MFKTIATLVPLFVPLVLAFVILRLNPKSRLEWMMAAWFSLAFSLFYFLAGAWFLLSVHARNIFIGVVLAAIVVSYLRLPKGIPFTAFSTGASRTTLISYLVPALIFTVMSVSALRGLRPGDTEVNLVFPLKEGSFYIAQAGGTTILNAHHPHGSQTYALDILGLNGLGRNTNSLSPTLLEEYAIFGAPVFAPCDGLIAAAVDGHDDLPPGAPGDSSNPAGNHVYLDCREEDVQVLLAHLKRDSLEVTAGSPVMVGDRIGQVGNSGNTSEPHLHIHARRGGTLDGVISGTGIPISFNQRFYVRNDIVKN